MQRGLEEDLTRTKFPRLGLTTCITLICHSPVPSFQVITPEDVDVGVMDGSRRGRISRKSITMFIFLVMLDFYRLAARESGDAPLPHELWEQEFMGLKIGVHPITDRHMLYSDAFFGAAWIWIWMTDLLPSGHSPNSGYFERLYIISRTGMQPQRELGYIQVGLLSTTSKK